MTSRKQILANQSNALRSTGPRTREGLQRSALNSLRHGLSGASLAVVNDPRAGPIARLLEQEGISGHDASVLAQRILDYERNEAHQQELFQGHIGDSRDATESGLKHIQQTERILAEGTRLLNEAIPVLGPRSEDVRDMRFFMKLTGHFNRAFNDQHRKNKRESGHSSQRARRYYKRAANQLAKTVKNLATPTP